MTTKVCAFLGMLGLTIASNIQQNEALTQSLAATPTQASDGSVARHAKYGYGDYPRPNNYDDRKLVLVHSSHPHHRHDHSLVILSAAREPYYPPIISTTTTTATYSTTVTVVIPGPPSYPTYGYHAPPGYYEDDYPVYKSQHLPIIPPPPPPPVVLPLPPPPPYPTDTYYINVPAKPTRHRCYNGDGDWGDCDYNAGPYPTLQPPVKYKGYHFPPPTTSYSTYYQTVTYSQPLIPYANVASPSIIYAEDEPAIPSPPYGHY